MILASNVAVTLMVIIFVPLGLGAIIFGVIMLKRHSKFFKSNDKKPTEQQIIKEELDRVLEDVEDEKTKKAMMDFEKKNAQNENKENK